MCAHRLKSSEAQTMKCQTLNSVKYGERERENCVNEKSAFDLQKKKNCIETRKRTHKTIKYIDNNKNNEIQVSKKIIRSKSFFFLVF